MRTSRYWRMMFMVAIATTFMNAALLYVANWYWDSQEPEKNTFLTGDKVHKPLNHAEVSRVLQKFGKCEFLGTLDGKRTIGFFDCKGIVTMEFLNE